jgi:hypothetical protein
LVVDEATLEERVRADVDFHRGASDEEGLIARFTERSVRYNAAVEQIAPTLVLRVERNETPDALAGRILERLG